MTSKLTCRAGICLHFVGSIHKALTDCSGWRDQVALHVHMICKPHSSTSGQASVMMPVKDASFLLGDSDCSSSPVLRIINSCAQTEVGDSNRQAETKAKGQKRGGEGRRRGRGEGGVGEKEGRGRGEAQAVAAHIARDSCAPYHAAESMQSHTMTLSKAAIVVLVVAGVSRLVRKTAMASARVLGLVSAPVISTSMPSFKLYSSSYDICSQHIKQVSDCSMMRGTISVEGAHTVMRKWMQCHSFISNQVRVAWHNSWLLIR